MSKAGTLGEERSWENSGGGFSNVFARPAYQNEAVASYLSSQAGHLPDSTYFNRTGRAYPDVSALAGGDNGYCISVAGEDFNTFTGTSASTPVWASVIALLNSIRFAKGEGPLGFLNPTLYAHPTALNDILLGANDAGTGIGFNATRGYDPTTGLGTINFTQLSAVLL